MGEHAATGIVLIGGRATRFGSDKVITPIGDRPLIEHILEVIRPIFAEILLVGHPRDELTGYRVVEDLLPHSGPLGGLYTALSTITTPYGFVFAADMPNLSRAFIEYMLACSGQHDIIIPVWSKGREPLHALYHRDLRPAAHELISRGALRIFDLMQGASTLTIPEETIRSYGRPEVMFANINTPHDAKAHLMT